MATRTVTLDKHRKNSAWRRSSSVLARDPHPVRPKTSSPPDQRPQLERNISNASANARRASHVNTTSTSSHDLSISASILSSPSSHPSSRHTQHPSRQRSTISPFNNTLSISSKLTPNSSVHVSPANNPPRVSSSRHNPSFQPASTVPSEVIDLTIDDTEDEQSVNDMLLPTTTRFANRSADLGSSLASSSSSPSSPLLPEHSLFTPPPPSRRRARLFVRVPSFPNGLTKADYLPMSHHSVMPQPGSTVANTHEPSPVAESPVAEQRTSSQERKGKERECDVVPFLQKTERRVPTQGTDPTPSWLLDAFHESTEIPLREDDSCPLTSLDIATNSRFHFAHAWREKSSKLRKSELNCTFTFGFGMLGKASIWARSVDIPSPRVLGTTSYVSIEQPRPWQSMPPEQNTVQVSEEDVHATENRTIVDVDANASCLLLPDDASLVPSVSVDSASQVVSSTVVDKEHDMNQFFNGLGYSPNKLASSRQQLSPTNAFRPHLLQSTGPGETNPSFELVFQSSGLDSRLADTSGHECFLGVPPSPTTTNMELAPGPIPDSPFVPASYFEASQNSLFATSADTWTFEQVEDALMDYNSPSGNAHSPTTPGTINPTLLGPQQPQKPSLEPKHSTSKRRSKLPEPVVYIRRPIDPSSLPLISGKRPVQIKYRDSGVSPATLSPPTILNEASSELHTNPNELSTSDSNESPSTKKRSVPPRRPREAYARSDSDSDYTPEASPKIKLTSRRPHVGSISAHQGTDNETVPEKSYCHQCRNRSARPKMLCSNMIEDRVCGKRFCNRCILYRYPDITFDEHSAGFLCPVCTNTCNCSYCSRNRGEEFISMRLGGLAASIFKSKVTLVRDVDEPLPRTRLPDLIKQQNTNETGLPTQPKFWAHVYGMEGDRVGSAFTPRGHMPPLSLSTHPKAPSKSKVQKPTVREKKPMGPRVFIGQPLPSWKVRALRDLEPSLDIGDVGKGKGKAKGSRWYVGNPAVLYEPYGQMPRTPSPAPAPVSPSSARCSTPEICSDRSVTPLSEMEMDSNWPQPEVGECCQWMPLPMPGTNTVVGRRGSDTGQIGLSSDVGLGSGPSMEGTIVKNGNGQGSMSTALSEQDLERAIIAALAALSTEPSC